MAGQESAGARGSAWWQAYRERRFGILLIFLTLLLAGPPVLFGFGLSVVWFDTLMALVVLAAIQSLCFERRQRLFALVLGIPTTPRPGGHVEQPIFPPCLWPTCGVLFSLDRRR